MYAIEKAFYLKVIYFESSVSSTDSFFYIEGDIYFRFIFSFKKILIKL